MKKVVWSTTSVDGGGAVEQPLAPLPDVAGPYQDCPRWGADPGARRWVAGLGGAGRAGRPGGSPRSCRPRCADPTPVDDWRRLLDGELRRRRLAAPGPGRPVHRLARAGLRRAGAGRRGHRRPAGPDAASRAAPPPSAVLEASDDGVTYRRVAELDAPGNADKAVPVRTRRLPAGDRAPVPAGAHRRERRGRRCPGWPRACGCRRSCGGVSEFLVSEFALFPGGRVHQAELKAGFAAAPDYYALDTGRRRRGDRPRPVVDVTRFVDGRRPALGRAGRRVADPAARRLADRADERPGLAGGDRPGGRQARRGEGAPLPRHLPGATSTASALDALLSDSIESGAQNHTDRLLERFTELRGYDPTPWLPALAGLVVGDAARTDRFLWDFRQTIADLVAERVLRHARARRRTTAGSSTTPRRSRTAVRSSATTWRCAATPTCPMGAMWLFDAGTGRPEPDLPRRPEGRVVGRARATASRSPAPSR